MELTMNGAIGATVVLLAAAAAMLEIVARARANGANGDWGTVARWAKAMIPMLAPALFLHKFAPVLFGDGFIAFAASVVFWATLYGFYRTRVTRLRAEKAEERDPFAILAEHRRRRAS